MEEWRKQIDPAVLREMNRRRVAKGRPRILGPPRGRPMTSFLRYVQEHSFKGYDVEQCPRYLQEVRENTPWRQEPGSYQDNFKALAGRVASQWRAMSEDEKAVRVTLMVRRVASNSVLADRNTKTKQRPTSKLGVKSVRRRVTVMLSNNGRNLLQEKMKYLSHRDPLFLPDTLNSKDASLRVFQQSECCNRVFFS